MVTYLAVMGDVVVRTPSGQCSTVFPLKQRLLGLGSICIDALIYQKMWNDFTQVIEINIYLLIKENKYIKYWKRRQYLSPVPYPSNSAQCDAGTQVRRYAGIWAHALCLYLFGSSVSSGLGPVVLLLFWWQKQMRMGWAMVCFDHPHSLQTHGTNPPHNHTRQISRQQTDNTKSQTNHFILKNAE